MAYHDVFFITMQKEIDGYHSGKNGPGGNYQGDFHFQGNDFNSNGPKIKGEKENTLKILQDNNNEVVEFFKSKEQRFLNLIKVKIEQKIEENQRKIDNSNTY